MDIIISQNVFLDISQTTGGGDEYSGHVGGGGEARVLCTVVLCSGWMLVIQIILWFRLWCMVRVRKNSTKHYITCMYVPIQNKHFGLDETELERLVTGCEKIIWVE